MRTPPPFELSDSEVVRAITDDSNPWNKARQIFRFRSAAIDGIGNPIEQRRQEFYAVLEIVQTVLAEEESSDLFLTKAKKSIREVKGSTASEAVIAAARRKERKRSG